MTDLLKALLVLLFALGLIPVSILSMMWGWGVEPHSWGWISFGYLWAVLSGLVQRICN